MKGLVWCFNGLTNPNNIDKNAGDALTAIYEQVELAKPLIIDCKGISGITDHAIDNFFKSINTIKREVHFLNITTIEQQLNTGKKEFCPDVKKDVDDTCIAIYDNRKLLKGNDKLEGQIKTVIDSKISTFIGKSFHPYQQNKFNLLSSTPIYANGEFDAAQLVSDPESFYWSSIRMSDEVDAIVQQYRIGSVGFPPKLLTVSLRSSPLAASIALLNNLQIETVDHFGPLIKNYETDYSLAENREYIYIGDFTVGGTEIKISKTYALMKGAKLDHAIVLGSLWPKELYKEFHLHSIARLRECADVAYSLEPQA